MIKKNRTYIRPKPIRVGGTLKRSEPWRYVKQKHWKLVKRRGLGCEDDIMAMLTERMNQDIYDEIVREIWADVA